VTRRTLLLFVLFASLAFLTRLVVLWVPIVDLDEAAYLVGGRELLRGRTPYVDFADHKPPLVFAYYAAAQLLGDGMLPVRLLTHLLLVPLVAFSASAFYRHDRRGVTAGLLFLVYSASFLGHDMLAVNCELLMLPPLGLAVVVLREPEATRRPGPLFLAGLLVGTATLVKYQAGVWAPALALAAWPDISPEARRGRRALLLAALALGTALPPLLAYAVFLARGAGDAFLYWNWTHNVAYATQSVSPGEMADRAASYLLPFLIATSPLWWASGRSWPALSAYQRRLVTFLLVSCFLAAFAGRRLYPHYFIPLYFPLALGVAPWVADHVRAPLRGPALAFVIWTAILLVGFTAANRYLYFARDDVYTETRPVFHAVAARLKGDTCFGNGGLFVWGFAPIFYAETGLSPATRFLFVGFSLVGHVSGSGNGGREALVQPEHWDLLMGDLERNRPAYVLDTSRAQLSRWSFALSDYPRLAAFVSRGYEQWDGIDGVVIYRRRDCPSPSG
jgi:hypothetical protein